MVVSIVGIITILANQRIGVRISLLKDSINGSSSYVETHVVTSSPQGVVQLTIGNGNVVSGNFSSIPWNSGQIFIKTEMDLQGGSNYTINSTTQFLSVPYSIYASDVPVKKSGDTVTIGASRVIIPGSQLIPSAAPASLNSGLVAYYPFNGNANDESGNGNHGTVNGATLTTDRYGNMNKAYSFDGMNDLIDLGNILNNIQTFSFSCWFLRDANGQRGAYSEIFSKENCFSFSINNSTNKFHVNFADGNFWNPPPFFESASNIVESKWNYITITRSMPSGETKLYYNGKLENSRNITTSGNNSLPLRVGSKFGVLDPWFLGKIDDIRFYNRVLTQEEIIYLGNN